VAARLHRGALERGGVAAGDVGVAAPILVSTLRNHLLAGGIVAGFLAITLIPSFSAAVPGKLFPNLGRRFRVEREAAGLSSIPAGSAHGPERSNYPIPANVKMAVVLQ
jgi:hypothetical protein